MSYATNIGKAISLQTPDRGDYWLRKAAQDLALEKQAKAKAKAAQDEKLADIYDIDLKGGYLPAWGKAVKGLYANYVNAVSELRAQDPNVSYAQLIALKNETKSRIEDLKLQNDGVVKYIQNPEYIKDEKWVNAAQTSDDFNEIAKFNNPTFYAVVPETGFTFLNPVKYKTYDIRQKFGTPGGEYFQQMETRGSDRVRQYSMDFPQGTWEAISSELKSDPEYYDNVLFELTLNDVSLRKSPTETMNDYVLRVQPFVEQEIDKRTQEAQPKALPKEEPVAKGTSVRIGDKDDRVSYAPIKDKINAIQGSTGVFGPVEVDSVPVYSEKPSTLVVTSDGSFIDYNNWKKIPARSEVGSISFGFKPNKMVVIKEGDVWRRYVLGDVTEPGSDDVSPLYEVLGLPKPTSTSWKTTKSVWVPYEKVSNWLEETNNLDAINTLYYSYGGEDVINESEFD